VKFIGLHPWWFVTLQLAVSTGLGGGFYFLNDLKTNGVNWLTDVQEQGHSLSERSRSVAHIPGHKCLLPGSSREVSELFPVSTLSVRENSPPKHQTAAPSSGRQDVIPPALAQSDLSQNSSLLYVHSFFNDNSFCQVSYFTSMSRLFEKSTLSVTELFAITYFLAIFGLLLLIKVSFVITVASSPFLILGKILYPFLMMCSFYTVPKRMADTYREAAVSITITTLTDVLAFYLSYGNPFGSVQSFCLYAACLALNGRREGVNRHWLTCMKVPEEVPPGRSKVYTLCCVGGSYDHNTGTEEEHPMTLFFRKYYGPFLTSVWSKALVIFIYLTYIAVSVYGCLQGIDLKNLALDKSYIIQYYKAEKTYFDYYGPNVMLTINGTFSYWRANAINSKEHSNSISSEDQFKTRLYQFFNVNERVVEATTHLGYLILQGALCYIFRTFFIIVVLVITFELLHDIAFMPVFLTFFGFCHKLWQH
uniref:SSD domain-containing protein n=1 Tax=Cyprinus carpio TaxID=7962 RepID=A0A8C2ITU0_CYPCA